MKRVSNRLLGVSVKTPPTLTKSRRPKGGKVLTMTPPIRRIVKNSDGVPTGGVKHTNGRFVKKSDGVPTSGVKHTHDLTNENESDEDPPSNVSDTHDLTCENESIDSEKEPNATSDTEVEESSVEDTKLPALTDTQLALRKKTNNFVESSSSSESELSANSEFDNITAEQKAEVLANNQKFFNYTNPNDAVYYRGRCCMDARCKAPIHEIRKPYVCTVCGKMYHNIFCGTYDENSSLCSGCSEKPKKKEIVVDKVQFVKPVTKTTEKAGSKVVLEELVEKGGSKVVLEEMVRKEDFGESWFYKTNDDLKKYAHFFYVVPGKTPRLFMAEPNSVQLDDLETKVCLSY